MALRKELMELSARVENYRKIRAVSPISGPVELSGEINLPYVFSCEALHPGTYKGFTIEEGEIVKAQNTIFESEDNFANYEINKDHKSSRKPDSSVDDVLGKVTNAVYDFQRKAYILSGEIYDQDMAIKLANGIVKFVSLRINPGMVDFKDGKRFARDLKFEELSFVRAPGDPNARIIT